MADGLQWIGLARRANLIALGEENTHAALRGGIRTVLIPEENLKDLEEIPDNAKKELNIIPVKWIDKVLDIALERQPMPLATDDGIPLTPARQGMRVSLFTSRCFKAT